MTDWEAIVRDHGRAVWRTAWRVLADAADADDCMQEAFADAVELSRRQPVRHWGRLLTRLAAARALDRLRRRIREAARRSRPRPFRGGPDGGTDPNDTNTNDLDALPGPAIDPGRVAEGREAVDRLRRALARLSPQQAEVFYLKYLEGMDYGEIAEALGIDVNQVGVVLHRARSRLRELLATVAGARKD